jgi:hypothetical protein
MAKLSEPEMIAKVVKKRHEGVELGRLIATVAVIHVHLASFESRFMYFAVPYFLALSGYYLANNLNPEHISISSWRNFAARHWRLFLFWGLFYSLLPPDWPMLIRHGGLTSGILDTFVESINKLFFNPINWLLDGPPHGFHLWYLAYAPIAAGVIFLLLKLNLRCLLGAIALASIAVLLSLDTNQCVGTMQWASNAKLGLLVAIPSIVAGWEFRLLGYTGRRNMLIAVILISAGLLPGLLGFELVAKGCTSIESILIGVGLLIFLLEWPTLPGGQLWVALGKLTVGVYILHIALRPILFSLAPKIEWFPSSLGFVFLACLTFLVVYVLSRFLFFKKWLS